ncbi:pantoate--beta-alanine ligase [Parvularcula dongshanensis]|uniref:Pantothenate synthetase n=1 Tax=Parvularcula dongshanensis TaxID=1173995 RepID=A0A840I4A2_9PROT|nr:pantoate--beta-alanine ligase [Parvularcula dongshanensis]
MSRSREELTKALSRWRSGGERIVLVPTMGALHEGHLTLVHAARRHGDRVVASIFVNPTQFAPNEDFDAYPRDEEADLGALRRAGCDLAYLPAPAEMYPSGDETRVVPGALAEPLEGASRPGFFTGVCTVVAKLFGQVRPDTAVFGEKDYQQLLVVQRMAADLALGVKVVGVPTVREPDGLALSSRNRYLSPPERRIAARLPETLGKVAGRVRGSVATDTALAQGLQDLRTAGFEPDYLELRRRDDLSPLPPRALRRDELQAARLFVAAKLGRTRLIDNVPLAE